MIHRVNQLDVINIRESPMKLKNLFHRWLNPHCEHCAMQKEIELASLERVNACKGCDILRRELDRVNVEKNRLLEVVLERSQNTMVVKQEIERPTQNIDTRVLQQVPSNFKRWEEQRRALESEDAHKAMVMKREAEQAELARRNAELDKELKDA